MKDYYQGSFNSWETSKAKLHFKAKNSLHEEHINNIYKLFINKKYHNSYGKMTNLVSFNLGGCKNDKSLSLFHLTSINAFPLQSVI